MTEIDVLSSKYDELQQIVGRENFNSNNEFLINYSGDSSSINCCCPHAIVWPKDTITVQDIVLWANRTGTALIPVSSGEPRTRGDTVPTVGGVIVNLGRMKSIVRINKRNRVAIIEPGVTYGDLEEKLAKEGLRIIPPLKPRKTKSVIGSILEREPCLAPRYHWDISDPLCCLEVIFGTGDVFRTGEAAGPLGAEYQWKIGGAQKFPNGPHQLDYHRLIQGAQGTMGIVTWVSVKCELLPTVSTLYFIPAENLKRLYDFTYEINAKYLAEEIFIANGQVLASLTAGAENDAVSLKSKFPKWVVVLVINGFERFPKERLEYQTSDIFNIAQKYKLDPVKMLNGLNRKKMLGSLKNMTDENCYKNNIKGGCKEIFFITPLHKTDQYIEIVYNVCSRGEWRINDIGIYIQPIVQGTSCHIEFQFYYDPENELEVHKTNILTGEAVKALIRAGAFFSRPYPEWADDVYRSRPDNVNQLKKIKSIFDPANIMNPGKLCF